MLPRRSNGWRALGRKRTFTPGEKPFWADHHGVPQTEDERLHGTVTVEPVPGVHAPKSLGPLQFTLPDYDNNGHVLGRLNVDAHYFKESTALRNVRVQGTVDRVELVLIRSELDGRRWHPVEQLSTLAANSTLDRNKYKQRYHERSGPEVKVDCHLLIWIDLDD